MQLVKLPMLKTSNLRTSKPSSLPKVTTRTTRNSLLKMRRQLKMLRRMRKRRSEIVNERRLKYSNNKEAVFESALYVYVKLY